MNSSSRKLLDGALAGFTGTAPMTAAMLIGWRFLPAHEKYALPPRQITGQITERLRMEAHKLHIETDRPYALREAIQACRKGGTVSLAGVYGGFIDTVPIGAAFNKGLTLKMGQTHVHRYPQPLFEKIERGQIEPSFVVTHIFPLEEASYAYEIFKHKKDGCVKVVLKP
ncbi:MAG TPA: hypothetical protein VI524_12170 [Anaerolineales bacterium]|nr:hypothetical protein [Anaerolineales bacterium]